MTKSTIGQAISFTPSILNNEPTPTQPSMNPRIVASILSVVSYLLLTSSHTYWGVLINLFCQVLMVPFCYKHKAYDMIGLSALFGGINLHYLVVNTTWN